MNGTISRDSDKKLSEMSYPVVVTSNAVDFVSQPAAQHEGRQRVSVTDDRYRVRQLGSRPGVRSRQQILTG